MNKERIIRKLSNMLPIKANVVRSYIMNLYGTRFEEDLCQQALFESPDLFREMSETWPFNLAKPEESVVSFSSLKPRFRKNSRFISLFSLDPDSCYCTDRYRHLWVGTPGILVFGLARIEFGKYILLPFRDKASVLLRIVVANENELCVQVFRGDRVKDKRQYSIPINEVATIYFLTEVFDTSVNYQLGYWSSEAAWKLYIDQKNQMLHEARRDLEELAELVQKERAKMSLPKMVKEKKAPVPFRMPDINQLPHYRAVKAAPSEPLEKRIPGAKRLCKNCSAWLSAEMAVCPNCGANVGTEFEIKEFNIIVEVEHFPNADHRFANVTISNRSTTSFIIDSLVEAGFFHYGEYKEEGIIRGDVDFNEPERWKLYKHYPDYREGDVVFFRRWDFPVSKAHRDYLESRYSYDYLSMEYKVKVELRHVQRSQENRGEMRGRNIRIDDPQKDEPQRIERRVIVVYAKGSMDRFDLYKFIQDQGYDVDGFENWPDVSFPYENVELKDSALVCEIGEKQLIMLPTVYRGIP